MRILLDENVDPRMADHFEAETIHVRDRGWTGIHNGELLRLADGEFDAFVGFGGGGCFGKRKSAGGPAGAEGFRGFGALRWQEQAVGDEFIEQPAATLAGGLIGFATVEDVEVGDFSGVLRAEIERANE
ncbi:MAG: hypothetical protein ABL962_11780, partial [Fimbriimonadaceae bacterium]